MKSVCCCHNRCGWSTSRRRRWRRTERTAQSAQMAARATRAARLRRPLRLARDHNGLANTFTRNELAYGDGNAQRAGDDPQGVRQKADNRVVPGGEARAAAAFPGAACAAPL